MWPRVILFTALLTALVMPLAGLLIAVPFLVLDLGPVGPGGAALVAQFPAAVLAITFHGPMVWLWLRYRELSAQLRDAAFTDTLTGAPNRRAFFAHAAARLGRAGVGAAGGDAPRLFSVLMIDVDRFKAVNDRWGHDGGDAALVYVACELGRALARVDVEGAFLARIGGEEFAVFLDGAPLGEATRAAEAICAHMRTTRWAHGGGWHAVTVSVGVWSGTAQGGADAGLAEADRALYAAKANGRDRWEVAGEMAARAVA